MPARSVLHFSPCVISINVYIYIYIHIHLLEYNQYIYIYFIYLFIYTMSTLLTKELQAKEYTIYNICTYIIQYIPRNSSINHFDGIHESLLGKEVTK